MMLFLLALIGATLIVTRSTAFQPIRRIWPSLLGCAQCSGAWVGAAAGASGVVPAGHGWALDGLIVGAATSFLSLLASAVLLRLLEE